MFKIDTNKKLDNFIEKANKSDVLCIDTEFIRENTYYPQLCLVQMQIDRDSFILDPFCFDDLQPLAKVLDNKNVLKVFHADRKSVV